MKYATMLGTLVVALGLSGMSAEACNPLAGKGAPPMHVPPSMLARNNANAPANASIVGLWHVIHTDSNGNLFLEGFDMWHTDGTEEEMANLPPAGGPVCFGAWSQSGKDIQLLTHVAFLYDLNNTYQGTLNMTQTNRLAKDGNSYKGTFDSKFYDPNGTLVNEVTGTQKADRLD